MSLKIDVTVPMQLPVPEQLAFIQRAEELGFDGCGLPDHMENGRDVFTVLGMAATRTSRIELYPCVTNPVTRHPWVLANVAHTLEEVAPGRFRLVIGAGDSAVLHAGRRPARVAELREAVSIIQRLLRGESVRFTEDRDERIEGIAPPQPPVVVAAGGPRMIELAGEIGDEAFLLTGFDERVLAVVKKRLQAGAERAGRSADGLALTHWTVTRIDDDVASAAEALRGRMLGWLKQGFFRESLVELGVDEALVAEPERIPAADLERHSDAFFLIGPAGKIVERLQEIERSGSLQRVTCSLSGTDGPRATLEAFARQVLSKVK